MPSASASSVDAALLERAARGGEEVGLDEVVDLAVEHGVDVAGLVLGAQVLHHPVGREHVAADLAAPKPICALASAWYAGRRLLALRAVSIS